MTEEEKKAIEVLKFMEEKIYGTRTDKCKDIYSGIAIHIEKDLKNSVNIVLNLIEKQNNKLEQLEKENIRLKYQDIPYLEGTIKGYKARIEELENQVEYDKTHIFTPQTIHLNFIPKSVIRDKIEELEKEVKDYQCEKNKINLYQRKILEEILGDE